MDRGARVGLHRAQGGRIMTSPCCQCSEILNEATGVYFCGGCGENIVEWSDAQVAEFSEWWNKHYPEAGGAMVLPKTRRGAFYPDEHFAEMRAASDRLEIIGRRAAYWRGWIDGAIVTGLVLCIFAVVLTH